MDSIGRFLRKTWFLIRRRQFNSELDEEMAFHRSLAEKELTADGMGPEYARDVVRRQFGNDTRLKEESREAVGFRMESVVRDSRFAVRQLWRNPGFACTATLVLALGIGASVAIFAFVDAALIKPLPYKDPSRLVGVYERVPMFPRSNLSYLDYLDWKRLNRVFSSFDVWTGAGALLRTRTGVEPTSGARVSAGFFRTLGVTPVLGRNFHDGEDAPGAPHVVMIGHSTWQRRFNGRQDVVGQAVTLNDVSYTIIGVLPRDFHFAPEGAAEFWRVLQDPNSCEQRRGCHNLYGVARLKDGVTVQTALSDVTSIARRLEGQYPGTNRGQGAAVVQLSDAIVGDIRPILLLLLAGAALLMLIACVNVSSLLLVRAESRKREIAVRGALGASRMRILRQMVTEGLVLAAVGSSLGLAAAAGAMQLLTKLIPERMLAGMPYLQGLTLNFRLLLFAGAVSLFAAALFSVVPVLRLRLPDVGAGLGEGGRGSAGTLWRRFGANLVVVELAVAMVLLVCAGLLGQSFYRLLHVDLGFQPDHLATIQLAAPDASYGKDEQVVALGRQLVSRISSLPGVKSVGLTSMLPVSGNGNTDWIRFWGRPYNGQHNEVNQRDVSSEYFATLRAKLLRGRFFTDREDATTHKVVVINRTLARLYFQNEDPIGKKIGDIDLTPKSIKEIIGVVDDIKEGSLDSEIWPAVYYPFNQSPDTYIGLVVRTSQSEGSIFPALAAAIHQTDPNIGTLNEATMTQRISDSQTAYLHRSSAWLMTGFAALALLLGVVGLYGVVAYSSSQRTREIGIRVALGAQRSTVYRLILKEAGWLTGIGVAAGLLCSMGASTLIRKLLFGVRSWDLPTLAAVAVVLAAAALLASVVPARRAAAVNPVDALRAE
jgi:predicted permease